MTHPLTALTAMTATVLLLVLAAPAGAQEVRSCPNNRSPEAATWYSVLHPGVGEWYLKGWGPFWDNAPQLKFWLGFIPIYGWPGYLQVKSAMDAHDCLTNDEV
jgi:hypothetical protein